MGGQISVQELSPSRHRGGHCGWRPYQAGDRHKTQPSTSSTLKQTKVFSAQVLNAWHYVQVTGQMPPPPTISAETGAKYGYPFYSTSRGSSYVASAFGGVLPVNQLDEMENVRTTPATVHMGHIEDVDGKARYKNFPPQSPAIRRRWSWQSERREAC